MLRRGASEQAIEAVHRKLADRASFELAEDELETLRAQLTNQTFNLAPSRLHSDITSATRLLSSKEAEYADWKMRYPSILDDFDTFCRAAHGKRLAVFLDYDGTLTPIVNNPDEAFMSDEMRESVRSVAQMYPTAIISGRGREKVEAFVQLSELYYAGSHGLDIVGPKDEDNMSFQPAAKFEPIMDAVYQQLVENVKSIEGATVEHNKFCVSLHFRNCQASDYQKVEDVANEVLLHHSGLKFSRGRKVFEIKPEVDWNKGKALQHLLEALELSHADDVLSLYIGDDRTDEDAFKVLKDTGTGIGILVSSKAKPTSAAYHLRHPEEVGEFLHRLVDWGHDEGNGWHSNAHCNGWSPLYSRGRSQPNSARELNLVDGQ
uniref:Trehalose 6-phosphate phosphatase n=1 Tax=Tetraselmis sp. GSL018 TaxID=582737 RepID=A0A061R3J9_9CHLO|mmetsp:Transcript_12107/g.28716  ORF Transcript_12107/g.28716 Transcript_12107/m.28716 type:complete len:376 (-) Transcript_12107:365-1492(-)